jgi:hypothetical protein
MFTGVATTLQQVMTEVNGAESEEERIMASTKKCIKIHKASWPLDFIGGKYDYAGEGQQQL